MCMSKTSCYNEDTMIATEGETVMFEKLEISKASAEEVKLSTPAKLDETGVQETLFSTPAKIELFPLAVRLKEASETAPPMEIQAAQLREEFLNIPELNRENWKGLSPEQRLHALNTLEQRAAEIGHRDPLPVIAAELDVDGVCKRDQIEINSGFLTGDSDGCYALAINAVIHEGRHAYQNYNMFVSQVEKSDQLVKAWRLNMELGYDNGAQHRPWSRSGLELNIQAREVDADAFTETVLDELEIRHYGV